jgi:predicted methyltransferase
MKTALARIALIGLPLAMAGSSTAAPIKPASFAAAVADPIRPPDDVARDADRKPAELMAFAGVRPGMTIAELAPGGGYFTRLLTAAVGPKGKVYAIAGKPSQGVQDLAQKRTNLVIAVSEPGTINIPGKVDMVWTTLNYHDFKNVKLPTGGDAAQALDKEAFRVLKPGGTYLIVDHETAPGAGASQTSTLHRIEDKVVRQEVQAAGFVLDGESQLLRHPADDHTAKVQETGIRGKTDQFILKFRKPR